MFCFFQIANYCMNKFASAFFQIILLVHILLFSRANYCMNKYASAFFPNYAVGTCFHFFQSAYFCMNMRSSFAIIITRGQV